MTRRIETVRDYFTEAFLGFRVRVTMGEYTAWRSCRTMREAFIILDTERRNCGLL